MGKNNIFHVITNEATNERDIQATLKDIVNNISCKQFVNYIRHFAHMSIIKDEITLAESTKEAIRKEMLPDLTKKELSKLYYLWRDGDGIEDNIVGRQIATFSYEYRGDIYFISLCISFRLNPETKKPFVHTEYSCVLNNNTDTVVRGTTVDDILYNLRAEINKEYDEYKILNKKYKNLLEFEEKMEKAPVYRMRELEKACES